MSLPSSPARSSLSRPHFPWTTYSHRSSSSLALSSGSRSNTPVISDTRNTSSMQGGTTSTSSSWNGPSSVRSTTGPLPGVVSSGNGNTEETSRQWSFNAFEWIVHDVDQLRDFLEGQNSIPPTNDGSANRRYTSDDFEILRESPIIGDGKFKLEISRTASDVFAPVLPTLSLFITSLMLEYSHPEFSHSASMMTAIKCQDDRAGERGARANWVWEHWQNDWLFRQESEVWECPLPLISTLLGNSRIAETNTFVICIQIHSPIGPFYPQQPSAYFVPRDLLNGLEASLDNSNTGDVRFICLEKQSHAIAADRSTSPTNTHGSRSHSPGAGGRSSPQPSHSSSTASHIVARKRVLYAHSDILISRSEYFATMLASTFSENGGTTALGERKLYTVIVEESDFQTIYWLLKWIYANWLLFKENDDPREAVDGFGAGWSVNWLSARGGEWDWKTLHKSGNVEDGKDDGASATSAESTVAMNKGKQTNQSPASSSRTTTGPISSGGALVPKSVSPTSRTVSSSTQQLPRRSVVPPSSTTVPTALASSKSGTSRPPAISSATVPPTMKYPVSPRSQRPSSHLTAGAFMTPDPHPHPTPPPPPASALSMYQVAHRYNLPGLASLALEHMMSTITPQSSFALLLATYVWEELRVIMEDYVVDKWEEVSASSEFEQCCQEIATGEWGTEGGMVLTALFRRLRSPLYART